MVHVTGPGFGEWVSNLTQERLRQVFGGPTSLRGWDYAFRDRVEAIQVRDDLDRSLVATVRGTQPKPYTTVVTVHRVPGGWSVTSECTCADEYLCKHAAAVVFAAQRSAASAGQTRFGAVPVWERAVQQALKPVATSGTASAPTVRHTGTDPLGLMIDVSATGARIRPVGVGRSRRWVHTGHTADLVAQSAVDTGPGFAPGHAEAVLELMHPVLGTRKARGWVDMTDLGGRLWERLEGAAAAGVAVVDSSGNAVERRARQIDPVLAMPPAPGAQGGIILQLTVAGMDPADVQLVGDQLLLRREAGVLVMSPLRQVAEVDLAALTRQETVVPADEVARFTGEYLPRLREHVAVSATAEAGDAALPPHLVLDLTFGSGHLVEMVWSSVYRTAQGRETRYYLRSRLDAFGRDAVAENQIQERILAVPGVLDSPHLTLSSGDSVVLRDEATLMGLPAAQFVEQVLPGIEALPDVEVVRHGQMPQYREAKGAPQVELATTDSADADWFDLHVGVTIDGRDVPLPQLFGAIARGDRHIILDDGTYFSIDRPELHQLRDLIEEARTLQVKDSGQLRLSALQAGLWEELVDLGVVRQQSERWRRAAGALLNVHDRQPAEVPAGINATLRPYQVEGYQWLSLLWDLSLGGILADDMGLGKTLQVLSLAQRALEAGQLTQPLLVVAPTSVLGTWVSEARKFAPDLQVELISQSSRRRTVPLADQVAESHLVVTSYPLLRIDADDFSSIEWRGMILDEAQFVKNHQAKTYQVARRLETPFKVAVTGTPLENSLMDLWSLLSIVAPGLYPNPDQFTENFRRPIEQDRDAARMATLRRRTRPLMLRRTKEEVARELPPKVEQTLMVSLNSAHRRTYDRHLARERSVVLGLMGEMGRNRIEVLAALTRLRQLALAPALVDDEYRDIASSKIDVLMEHLAELAAEGHRALVFSQFTGFLGLIRQRLEADGIPHEYLDGATRDRTRRIDRFKDGSAPVFLISLKAGGFGLNLTEAGYVFVMDPWWNPAAEEQAIDRTHRIGQDKTVMVYRLVSQGTIEEKVISLQERKRELFRDVVGEAALSGGQLTPEDIRGLLAED